MSVAKEDAGSLISIHAAREGGDFTEFNIVRVLGISIHAAREGGDRQQGLKLPDSMISIHAAREGGDSLTASPSLSTANFNPRRP